MDYRRTRQPSSQQPHVARDKSTARSAPDVPRGFGRPAPPTVPMRPSDRLTARPIPRPTPELGVEGLHYDYTTPVILDALAADLTLSEEDTERIWGARDIAILCNRWRKWPIFDPEYEVDDERVAGAIAGWHDDELKRKALRVGCSPRMINILEELVRCFVYERRPYGILAARLLLEY